MSTNKIALITGGSRGLGKNMAIRLAERGHDVVITYNSNREAADDVVAEIEAKGGRAAAIIQDVADFKSLPGFLEQFTALLKSKWNANTFDFLINNAGIGATIPFEKATEDDFDKFLNIHFKSVYFLTQQALPIINNNGRIINISTGTTRFCVPGFNLCFNERGHRSIYTIHSERNGCAWYYCERNCSRTN